MKKEDIEEKERFDPYKAGIRPFAARHEAARITAEECRRAAVGWRQKAQYCRNRAGAKEGGYPEYIRLTAWAHEQRAKIEDQIADHYLATEFDIDTLEHELNRLRDENLNLRMALGRSEQEYDAELADAEKARSEKNKLEVELARLRGEHDKLKAREEARLLLQERNDETTAMQSVPMESQH